MELKSIINIKHITVTVIVCVRVCALQKTDDYKNVKKQRSASSVKKKAVKNKIRCEHKTL